MTPFWTPVVPAPVTVTGTALSYSDDGDYQAYILRSQADWVSYWSDAGLTAPAPPTDFSNLMVFVPGTYGLQHICYTKSNVVVYQISSGGGPVMPCYPCSPISPIAGVTVTHVPTLTPVSTPSALPHGFYLIPASSLPVSFISTFMILS